MSPGTFGRAAATALCCLALAAAGDPPAPEDWRVERQEWTWPVLDDAVIRVDNPWGDLAVRTHGKSEIYLLANWQHHVADPRGLEVSLKAIGEESSVTVDFAAGDSETAPASWARRRADVTVFVPESARTHFSTSSGNLEVRGTRGHTTVETQTGAIRLRIAGGLTARSEHGNVLAQLARTDWAQPIAITTVTGSIRVEMPRGGRAAVTLETRGEITSDYSMHVERTPGSQLKRARVNAGPEDSALGRIELRSYSGSLQIVETLVAEQRAGQEVGQEVGQKAVQKGGEQ